ncbi:DUF4870 family protein [Denitromonas ohlonensis]|uniref:Transmembrane protein n=2 Tax=Denitromonas TaxID=139331 RepID=A0A558EYV9_9RHOO|nr:hypothetical protein [Denitromonas ohlonensis]TVO68091.1 hypothetical protein FHP90_05815 [Denitromonas ohlonensis]TVO78004.1 hypothetical protein FHP89_05845 [Denitromonas ohlonensis]TVT78545.1 MAG: hypothetical protein FHP92_01445 [Denitromonas halophila]
MAQTDTPSPSVIEVPREGLINLAHLIYGLHAIALFSGIATSATIIGSFVSGLPSIIAVILNYVKRDAVRGTWLDSHYRWQIRTFWFALLWFSIAWLMAVTIIGLPIFFGIIAIAGLWVLYRVVRGWINLSNRVPMPVD